MEELLANLRAGDVQAIGSATDRNFAGPIQTIILWASNAYTETLSARTREHFQQDFWGFWMLGDMSGGGMGFRVAPQRHAEAQDFLQATMSATKRALQHSLPFAMEPVVYDFAINPHGTRAELLSGAEALLPPGYYALQVPRWLRQEPRSLSSLYRAELDRFGAACRTHPDAGGRPAPGADGARFAFCLGGNAPAVAG
jgi:hypothetical protein